MNKDTGWLKRAFFEEYPDKVMSPKRYRQFRRTLFLVMSAAFFIPLILTTWLSYYEYRSMLMTNLRWNAESAKRTIETFITELKTVLVYTSHGHAYEELLIQENLNRLYYRLKSNYPGVVDVGIIDSLGIQQAYAGPYDLAGRDYNDRSCCVINPSGKCVFGQVEMGYRNVPHFCIAVNVISEDDQRQWVFRAGIDASILDAYIEKTGTGALSDIFLVSWKGDPLLQSTSRFYGPPLTPYPFGLPNNRHGVTISEEKGSGDSIFLTAVSYLEDTPWALVLMKKGYVFGIDWSFFKARLFFIVLLSTILALIVFLWITKVFVGHIREADEKRETVMAEIEHTSKLASIGRLAAGVAHEINNPLAIISAKTGLVMDLLEITSDFEHKERIVSEINGTSNAVERCKVITHRLLGFARRMDVTLEPININILIREVLGFLDQEALYRGIHIELKLADSLPVIESDRGQLQQVFLNLINNAIDAIERDGMVTISTTLRDRSTIQVDVADNGKGISQDIMSHIFEPFFTTKDGEKKGTGLGLFITYGIIRKLGGNISVRSTADVGSTFTVTLPAKVQLKRSVPDVKNQGSDS